MDVCVCGDVCVWGCMCVGMCLRASFTYFGGVFRCPHKRIVTITKVYITRNNIFFFSEHYPRQDVVAQISLRNCCRSSATLLAAVIVPNVSVMYFSHLCLGFPRLLFPATIPGIIVFSKPLWRVTWPKYFSF